MLKSKVYIIKNHKISSGIAQSEEDLLVFIDVLRTSNTIIALIYSGAHKVIPISQLDAVKKIIAHERDSLIFVGERKGKRLDFCNYGNSPTEIIADRKKFAKKTMVITTTNFTKVLEYYREKRCFKIVGSLLNLSRIKDFVSLKRFRNIFLIPVGRRGKPTIEDNQTARYIKDYLRGRIKQETIPDFLIRAYRNSKSGSNLKILGYEKDVELCLRLNYMNIIPVFRDGYFTRLDDYER